MEGRGKEKGRGGGRERKRERITHQANKGPHPSSRLVTLRQVVMSFVPGPEQTE